MKWPSWFESWFVWLDPERRREREEDLQRELRAHLDLESEEHRAAGASEENAENAARRIMGNPALIMEDTRAAWRWARLERFGQDIRFAGRSLRKNLGYSLLAAFVLALGIGANTAIFTVVNATLLQPLPFEEPGRLTQIFHVAPQNVNGGGMSGVPVGNFVEWRAQQRVFEGVALYRFHGLNLTSGDRPDLLQGAEVSEDFFSVLREKPFLGRTFAPDEAQPGREREVVLSYSIWQSHFGGDRSVVGRTFSFDRQNYTVIGVMPQRFRFPGWARVWVPAAWTAQDRANRSNHGSLVVARLKPAVTLGQAQAEMNAISRRLAALYPAENAGWGAMVVSLQANMVAGLRTPLLVLLGAVAFVLLIACSNVANMVLARTLSRRKEIAIRGALGATRGRVLQLVLVETAMLSLCGGVAGLLVARYAVRLLVDYLGTRLPGSIEVRLDTAVLLFAFGISAASGVLAGLLPALRFTRQVGNLHEALKQGRDRTGADGHRIPARRALVVAEVALCMVLLIGAGLLVRTIWELHNTDPGFDPHQVVTMDLPRPAPDRGGTEFNEQVLQRLRGLPGVEAAAAASNVPLSGYESTWSIQVEGQPPLPIGQQPDVPTDVVTPGFFATLRIPLLRGRDFRDADNTDRSRVIIVSEAMAKRFWPNQDPIGKHLYISWTEPEKPREIVGVAGNRKEGRLDNAAPLVQMYVPAAQARFAVNSIVVRTATSPADTISAVTRAIHEIDRRQPVVGAQTLQTLIADSYSDRKSNALLLLVFAVLGLLLATAGIYGVLSYGVRRRSREIAIRLALGAEAGDVLWMVLLDGMRPTLLGMALGIGGALALGRVLAGMIYGIRPSDGRTFISAAALLAGVALLACIVPAYRAAQLQPLDVLRDE
ncbi:MAG: ABC transporter permease [Acidobacteriia bacterium]|nr:ABC transporter permease [Terriglobia bacterium]